MYLEIDEGFDAHPKTVRLCRVMGDVNAGQYLIRLWAWACRSAPDGNLSGMEAGDIEAIAKYKSADGKLFAALTERWSSKFGAWLDLDGDSLKLHGWDERTGAAIAKMDKRAADMRALRDKRKRERDGNVTSPCNHGETHVGDQTRQDKTSQDQTSQDPEKTICAETPAASSPPVPVEPPLLTFPCDGESKQWHLVQSQVDHWQELFPSRDIMADCRAALAWIEANPSKRKTASGMPRTLVGWFGRAQNRGQQSPPQGRATGQTVASWGKPITMADVEAARRKQTNG